MMDNNNNENNFESVNQSKSEIEHPEIKHGIISRLKETVRKAEAEVQDARIEQMAERKNVQAIKNEYLQKLREEAEKESLAIKEDHDTRLTFIRQLENELSNAIASDDQEQVKRLLEKLKNQV